MSAELDQKIAQLEKELAEAKELKALGFSVNTGAWRENYDFDSDHTVVRDAHDDVVAVFEDEELVRKYFAWKDAQK